MTDQNDAILNRLPGRLKEARRKQGLSLDAVAKLSGVSRSMVSQIERGESSPTIATLWNLTRALQVDFAGLLDESGAKPRIEVLRHADVPTIDNNLAGCRIRILSPPEDVGAHEVYDLSFAQAGALRSEPHAAGTKEHLTIVAGRVEVTSGDHVELLYAGDTARYAADVAHEIKALSPDARMFLIVHAG
jgi:transcriptional regulator with XRE-family HTH domain